MPHTEVNRVRILYCASPPLARDQIIAGIGALPDIALDVVDSFDEMLESAQIYDGIILSDAPSAKAAQLIDSISRQESRVKRLHFLSAGREGFLAAGIPDRFETTGPNGASAPAVAEQAMALLLALARRIPDAVRALDARRWDRPAIVPGVRSLEGLTAVVVGMGAVGRQIAARLRPFGTHTIGVVRTPGGAGPDVDEVVTVDRLMDVLPSADVVILALALTEQTRHLIGAEQLAAMKTDALLVNIARGGVIDQDALIEALTTGAIGGAGLDVTDPEPLPESSPLWSAPNLVLTPHYGGASRHTFRRTAESAIEMARTLAAEARN